MRRHIYETFPLVDADRVVDETKNEPTLEIKKKKWFSWLRKADKNEASKI